jgi:hypothetical protein
MLVVHFGNGDGSPPITALTANDSYSEKESRREEDCAEGHARVARSPFSFFNSNSWPRQVMVRGVVSAPIGFS